MNLLKKVIIGLAAATILCGFFQSQAGNSPLKGQEKVFILAAYGSLAYLSVQMFKITKQLWQDGKALCLITKDLRNREKELNLLTHELEYLTIAVELAAIKKDINSLNSVLKPELVHKIFGIRKNIEKIQHELPKLKGLIDDVKYQQYETKLQKMLDLISVFESCLLVTA